jgi:glycosyltransferase involved in cell wall biosynthesis
LGDRFVIFSGGKLEYRKGQDIVIEAFRRFQQRHPDALLLTAWHNIWHQTMHSIEQSGYVQGVPQVDASGTLQIAEWLSANGIPAGSVIDVGAIANPLVGQVVREADVALFPNRCEGGTNLAAMECLACGVPTILSANTGHRDLIRDGMGYALPTQQPIGASAGSSMHGWGESSVDEILEQLEWMYAHRDQARQKALNDAVTMQEWTWEKQVGRLLGVLGDRQLL